MAYDYEVRVRRLSEEDGGVYVAEVPELPGCMSDGETPAEAAQNVQSAIQEWLAAAAEDGRPIPSPKLWEDDDSPSGRVSLRLPKSMHRRLLQGAESDGVSLNQHVTHLLGLALGISNEPVAAAESVMPGVRYLVMPRVGSKKSLTSTDSLPAFKHRFRLYGGETSDAEKALEAVKQAVAETEAQGTLRTE